VARLASLMDWQFQQTHGFAAKPQKQQSESGDCEPTFCTVHKILIHGISQKLAENKKGQSAGPAEGPGDEQVDLTEAKR
jgi:hypothetical protein